MSINKHEALVLILQPQQQTCKLTCEHAAWQRRTGSHLESQLLWFGLQQLLHSVYLTGLGALRCCRKHVHVGHNHLQHLEAFKPYSMLSTSIHT